MKSIILIHGCHIQAGEWESIMFGTLKSPGRVPRAIEESINQGATFIFWGSGLGYGEGVIESNYTFEYATTKKLGFLSDYLKMQSQDLLNYLNQISVFDSKSTNTFEEVQEAFQKCKEQNIDQLFLVSSPTHIARCLQNACKLKYQTGSSIKVNGVPCDTSFANSTPADVVIFEPPHREDLPKIPLHKTLQGVFPLLKDTKIATDFNEALKKLIQEYQS